MILKLDPRWPLVWRSPTSVQIGIDPPRVILHDVTETDERMLAALAVGVSASGLELIGAAGAASFVAQVEAALLAPSVPRREPVVAVSGSGPLTAHLATTLGHHGIRTLVATDHAQLASRSPDFAVIVADYVVSPELHGFWLRRDVPHLSAVFSDTGATVSPVVEPGSGPCLVCLDLHHRDADPHWSSIATQLLTRRAPAAPPVLVSELVGRVGRMVLQRLDGHPSALESVHLDGATGEATSLTCAAHPSCACRSVPDVSAVRRGIGSASADPTDRFPTQQTTTARASGAHA